MKRIESEIDCFFTIHSLALVCEEVVEIVYFRLWSSGILCMVKLETQADDLGWLSAQCAMT